VGKKGKEQANPNAFKHNLNIISSEKKWNEAPISNEC
jgi:hypothetical protein